MTGILALVERVLGILLSVLGLTAAIRQDTLHAAQEHSDFLIEGIVTTAGVTIAHPTWGLQAIHNELVAEFTLLNGEINLIHGEVDAILSILTPAPPDTTAIANAVWGYNNGGTSYRLYPAFSLLEIAHTRLVQQDHTNVRRLWDAPIFGVQQPELMVGVSSEFFGNTPEPDFADIRSSDTVLTWLTRTELHFTWAYDPSAGLCQTTDALPGGAVFWCLLSAAAFDQMKVGALQTPPIWPGIPGAVLGTPVAIAADMSIAGPLDGVLVHITAVPPGTGDYSTGTAHHYRHPGWLMFVSDNGDFDAFQWVDWSDGVLTPQLMASAASVSLKFRVGVTGTVTPWSLA